MNIINDKTGDTYLHSVVAGGLERTRAFFDSCHEFRKDLLEVSNKLKQRPLHIAVANLDAELTQYLLEKGAEVDAFKKGDWTSLMIASASNNSDGTKVLKVLLKFGANPNLKNKDGWTVMHLACRTGNVATVMELLAASPKLIKEPSRNGRIPLHVAALNGHKNVASALINHSGTHLCNTKDSCGCTPIMDAITYGDIELFNMIRKHCLDVKQLDLLGLSGLHKAAQMGHTQMATHLVQAEGFDVDESTATEGYTPLHYAIMENHKETVLALLCLGASTLHVNKYNQTAFSLPRGVKSEDLLKLLQECKK